MRIRSLFAALTLACFAPLAGAQTYGSPQANLTSPSTMSFNGIALSTKLPDARQYRGYTVFTSDLGLLVSDGTSWVTLTGAVSTGVVTATGSTTPRTLGNRFADIVNVKDFGAKCDGATDDSAAFSAAIATVNSRWVSGTANTLYIPAGRCYINAPLTQFAEFVPGRIQGDGMHQTYVVVGPGLTGNVFSWDEAWTNSSLGTPTYDFATAHVGGGIADLAMIASTTSGAQNAIACLDRCDFFTVQNVDVRDFNGSALTVGTPNYTTVGFMRESNINNFKAWHDGSLTAPVINLSCVTDVPIGNSDCTNEIQLTQIDIYDPRCIAVAINNQSSIGTAHLFQFHTLRIEGGPQSTCDLLKIGDTTANGDVHTVSIFGLEEIAVPSGAYGIHFSGTSNNLDTMEIVGGYIGSGPGGGITMDVAKNFELRDIYFGSSLTTALTVAASTYVNCCIRVDGAMGYPTTSIDATSFANVLFGGGQGSGTYPPWHFDVFGNLTHAATISSPSIFGTTGLRTVIGGANVTDTSSSGTILSTYLNKINGDSLRASSPTTLTNAYSLDIEVPTASTNITCGTCGSLRLAGQLQANGLINGLGGLTVSSGSVTTTGGNTSINANTNNTVNIGTGTNNQQVTIGGGSNAVTLNSTTLSLTGTLAGTTVSNYLTAPGPIGSVTPNTGAFTTLTSNGVTDASVAAAGKVGEVASINCIVGSAGGAAAAVTVTVAAPGIVNWPSHTFVPSSGLANYTCPINFLGTPPTGISVGTTYWIIGSTVGVGGVDKFQISDTAAHALAGTNAVTTTGSDGGTTAFLGAAGANGTAFTAAGLMLVAGDWDCTALGEYQELTSLTTSAFKTGVSANTTGFSALGTFTQVVSASGAIGANNYYQPSPSVQENVSATTTISAITSSTFSVGTMNEGGVLRCRRMR